MDGYFGFALYSGPTKINFQVTEPGVAENTYACFRITRHCYVLFEQGLEKAEIVEIRNEYMKKLKDLPDNIKYRPATSGGENEKPNKEENKDKKEKKEKKDKKE